MPDRIDDHKKFWNDVLLADYQDSWARLITSERHFISLVVIAMEVVHPRLGSKAVVAKPNSLSQEPRMNVHKHARMTSHGRLLLVQRIRAQGWRVAEAAAASGVSVRTAKWLARHRTGRRARPPRPALDAGRSPR